MWTGQAGKGDNARPAPAFMWNDEELGGDALPLAALHGILRVGLFMGLLKLTIDGATKAAVMTGRRLPQDDYFCAIVSLGQPPPDIKAIPCWRTEH